MCLDFFMKDEYRLRSTVHSSLLRFLLIRGTFFAGLGIGILFYGGAFLSPELLSPWGWVLFGGGAALITLGLLPYKKMCQLQLSPNELLIDEQQVSLFLKGERVFGFSLDCLKRVEFVEKGNQYGIACWLEHQELPNITVYQPRFDMERFQNASQKRFHCDLFLPYFGKRACKELEEFMQ